MDLFCCIVQQRNPRPAEGEEKVSPWERAGTVGGMSLIEVRQVWGQGSWFQGSCTLCRTGCTCLYRLYCTYLLAYHSGPPPVVRWPSTPSTPVPACSTPAPFYTPWQVVADFKIVPPSKASPSLRPVELVRGLRSKLLRELWEELGKDNELRDVDRRRAALKGALCT